MISFPFILHPTNLHPTNSELEKGKLIDMLEPPVDPLRPRMRKTEPLYKPSTSNGTEGLGSGLGLGLGTSVGGNTTSGGSSGFDLDAVPQFDTNVDYNKNWSQTQSGSSDEGSKSKPFWKIW